MTTRVLYLMRHAAALDTAATHRDLDRELSPAGRAEARAAGEWLREREPAIGHVLVSPATRTQQTVELLGLDASVETVRPLYNSGSGFVRAALSELPDDVTCALVVGHAPGIPATVHELAAEDSDPDALAAVATYYPTATISRLELAGDWGLLRDASGCARLTATRRS